MTTVSPVPASSQPAEPASAATIASRAAAGPDEVSVFSAAHATKNSTGGDTTTGSRPLGRT
jgi:hypothetical protein